LPAALRSRGARAPRPPVAVLAPSAALAHALARRIGFCISSARPTATSENGYVPRRRAGGDAQSPFGCARPVEARLDFAIDRNILAVGRRADRVAGGTVGHSTARLSSRSARHLEGHRGPRPCRAQPLRKT